MTTRRAAGSPSPIIYLVLLGAASVVSFSIVISPYVITYHNPNAISIGASLTPTEAAQNQTIKVTVSDRNNLRFADGLPISDNFRVQNLSSSPCGGLFPFAVAVFQGRYDLGNISYAKPIEIFDDFSAYFCPAMIFTNTFTFKAQQNVTRQVDLNGYWTAGETQHPGGGVSEGVLHPFLPGEYTLAAGDEWGHVQILYFQVTASSSLTVTTTSGLVGVVSVTGPIPPYNPGGPVVGITLKNIGETSITSLNATLAFVPPPNIPGGIPVPYSFVFNVSSSCPLLPGQSIQETQTLIGAGFGSGTEYPLTINGALTNGTQFSYTEQVQIVPPS